MPLTASEITKSKEHEESRANWSAGSAYQTTVKVVVICKTLSPARDFQADLFYQRCSVQDAAAPQDTDWSLLELVGIPGCACEETGMPRVHTRLIALGKEADAACYFYP